MPQDYGIISIQKLGLNKELNDQTPLKFVLDSSAFIGLDFPALLDVQNVVFYTLPSVIKELKDFRSKSNYDLLKEIKDLFVIVPESETLNKLKLTLKKIDPNQKLSSTDVEVLSLTKELGGTLVSSDLALQNIGALLDIKINNISGKKIKNQRVEKLRCTSCQKIFHRHYKECPDCGGSLKGIYSVHKRRLKQKKG